MWPLIALLFILARPAFSEIWERPPYTPDENHLPRMTIEAQEEEEKSEKKKQDRKKEEKGRLYKERIPRHVTPRDP